MKEIIAGIGSVASAFLASLCCIGPLLGAALGVGGLGAVASLEAYRPYFLGVMFVFLGAAFYFTYGRKTCEDGAVCQTGQGRRWQRALLWIAAAFALIFMAVPYLLAGHPQTAITAGAGPVKQVALPVEGMTCGGCAISVKAALKGLKGVRDANLDVEKGEAVVTYTEGAVTVDQMVQVINGTGFTARRPSAG